MGETALWLCHCQVDSSCPSFHVLKVNILCIAFIENQLHSYGALPAIWITAHTGERTPTKPQLDTPVLDVIILEGWTTLMFLVVDGLPVNR